MATQSEDGVQTDSAINESGVVNLNIPPADLQVLYQLGMPTSTAPRRYIVTGDNFGSQYSDIVIEFFGIEGVLDEELAQTPGQPIAAKWTVYAVDGDVPNDKTGAMIRYGWTDGRSVTLHIWRQRIIFKDTNVNTSEGLPYIEELWCPDTGTWMISIRAIGDPIAPQTAPRLRRLADVIALLRLSLGQKAIGGYSLEQIEDMIEKTIETMAQAEPDKSRPRRFKVKRFADSWPIRTSRTNIYNYVKRERLAANGEIEVRYKKRCAELAREVSKPSKPS